MKNSSRFFANKECEYYPCHEGKEEFSCMFCYCPMYQYADCPGNKVYKNINGKPLKICTNCTFPHNPENYDFIMEFLKNKNR